MDPALSWTLALALAMLSAASAAMKSADISQFSAAVDNYRILPQALVTPAAWMIPALEALAALGLLLSATRAGAALLMAVLLPTLSAALAIKLARGRRGIHCGFLRPGLRQTPSRWPPPPNAVAAGA